MAAITAAQVKLLRDETGLPMMECKTALTEADGSTEDAKVLLQKKYKGKMESRASNVTGEGRITLCIPDDRKSGAIIDLRCETAPVAKTEQFIALANAIAETVHAQNDPSPAKEASLAFAAAGYDGKTIGEAITDVFGILRENLNLECCRKLTGEYLCGYVHHDGKTGVLVALDATPNPDSVATDLCHHLTFANPMAIDRSGIPADEIAKVERVSREVAESEGKPPHIVDKIVEGKVNAFCAENALMEQEHVKVSKTKVGDVLRDAGVGTVTEFVFFKIGG